uniref:Uncharacterized protein n=1 Tax=Vitis vinifera TaxID=29760 RepID=A5CBA3_VITVI|nr:hypothetical protein VITISV_037137 [Vitis vinifera]
MVMGAGREGGCSDEVGGGGSPRVQHEVAVMIVEFEERILSDPYPVFKSFQEWTVKKLLNGSQQMGHGHCIPIWAYYVQQQEGIINLGHKFLKLRVLRQGLDHYQHFEMEAAVDTIKLNKLIEQERIFESLAGLNSKLDRVRA